jgi:chitinase
LNGSGVTHVIVATIHLDATSGNIKLNDDPYTASKYNVLWSEVRSLQAAGITVLGMLGGAVQGSFGLLDGDDASFNHSYSPLREMLAATSLNGIDIDVEEPMSLSGVVRLIGRLKNDFGSNIIVTLAPVATALRKKKINF